jgi:hypothetical protein
LIGVMGPPEGRGLPHNSVGMLHRELFCCTSQCKCQASLAKRLEISDNGM